MKKKKLAYVQILILLTFFIEVLALLVYFIIGESLPPERAIFKDSYVAFLDDWILIDDTGNAISISLPTTLDQKYDHTISIQKTLPEDIHNQHFMLWNKGHELEVYINGELRLTTKTEIHRLLQESPPYHFSFIELRESDAGSVVEIFFNNLQNENAELGEAYVGNQTALIIRMVSKDQLGIFFSFLLIILSTVTIITAFFVGFEYKEAKRMIYLGFGVLLLAIWYLFNCSSAQFLFPNVSTVRDLAFYIASILLVPFILYVNNIQKRRYQKFLYPLVIACLLDFIVITIGSIVFKIELNILFVGTEFVVFVGLVIFFVLAVCDCVTGQIKEYFMYSIGLLGFAVGAFIYIIAYALFPYKGDSGMLLIFSILFMLVVSILALIHDIKIIYGDKVQAENSLNQLSKQAMASLARTVDAKDRYTNGHSNRVALYAVKLAKALGYSQEEISTLKSEALLHDIGKIGIPDSVLNKPGKLTDIEFSIMKSHTTLGEDILKNMLQLPFASVVAGQHHERYNGKGYPLGLSGEEIHPHARIVCIADAYDAMSMNRVYRPALSEDRIREELVKGRGTQFDPDYVDVFLKLFDEGKLQLHQMHQVDDFSQKQEVLDNLLAALGSLSSSNITEDNFAELGSFTANLKPRYHRSFELVMISLKISDGFQLIPSDIIEASSALEMAITKNIRTIDIYHNYNQMQHLLLLVDAGMDNIDVIIQRIYLDFYKLYPKKNFVLTYQSSK